MNRLNIDGQLVYACPVCGSYEACYRDQHEAVAPPTPEETASLDLLAAAAAEDDATFTAVLLAYLNRCG